MVPPAISLLWGKAQKDSIRKTRRLLSGFPAGICPSSMVFASRLSQKHFAQSLVISSRPRCIMSAMTATRPSRKESRAWQARRKKAEQMFAAGAGQSEIARAVGVSRQCIHNWFWQWQGADGSRPRVSGPSRSGRKAKLGAPQLAEVDAALRRGPQSFGFAGQRWTLWRVATVIERITGVAYHPSSIWRILRTLGWTLRLPPLPPSDDEKPRGYIPRHWTAPSKPQIVNDGDT
jgi:transposase